MSSEKLETRTTTHIFYTNDHASNVQPSKTVEVESRIKKSEILEMIDNSINILPSTEQAGYVSGYRDALMDLRNQVEKL